MFQVFCTFASLILGFVFSFYILFKSNETEFYSIWETFVKVVAMMSEFNYSETFKAPPEMNSTEVPIYEVVSRLVFLLFVVLIAIVLMNLMIGLAVSDITILEAQGKSQRLAKQIDFLHLLETFVYSETLLKWLPEGVRNHIRKNRKVSEEFTFSPGKPYGSEFHRLPTELRKTIMNYLLLKKNACTQVKSKQEKKFYEVKTLCDRLLAISEELDAIKRDYYERNIWTKASHIWGQSLSIRISLFSFDLLKCLWKIEWKKKNLKKIEINLFLELMRISSINIYKLCLFLKRI